MILGIFIGTALGIIIMCLMQVNRENWQDKVIKEQQDEIKLYEMENAYLKENVDGYSGMAKQIQEEMWNRLSECYEEELK